LSGASLEWEAIGRDAHVLKPSTESNSEGIATAGWQLGTNASEEQLLRVLVRTVYHQSEIVIRARAIPHVVAQLRVSVDTPAVIRLGDSLPIVVTAVDPFGNTFPAPAPRLSVGDTTVGKVVGSAIIAGPKRGMTQLTAGSERVAISVPLRVVQYVASITPALDTLWFTSLRAQLPVAYVMHDDKGAIVADTVAGLEVIDTVVARLTESGGVRSFARGVTALRLSVGSATATITLKVQQRVASLAFRRDTILLDALRDTTTIHAIAHDSLGSLIEDPDLTLQVSDGGIVSVDDRRILEAHNPGVTFVVLLDPETGISSTAPVVVRQVVTTIRPSVTRVVFDALGDSSTITATAADRLGSLVAGVALDYSVNDLGIVSLAGGHLRAVAPGQVSVTVHDPVSGTRASVEVVVDQIATSLTVSSTFGSLVVNLAVGSPFPLKCQSLDKNGYPIDRDPVLIGSLKGTVTGSGCVDARVSRSGYDTLVFAAGNVRARLGVIVAARPDSVAVLAAAAPLPSDERIRFEGEDLANPLLVGLRPLVRDIFVSYGEPSTSLDRARVLRDWVARTAVHPYSALHPDNSSSNLSVLPPGTTWADVNQVQTADKIEEDRNYWGNVGMDGYEMLDRLLGTLDPISGQRADDGLMVQVLGARYRIRDITSYRYVLCSYQDIILNALWAAAGLHGMLISTVGHDPAAVFIPELGRWVYQDPEFNDEYRLDGSGDPLSPVDLLSMSTLGQAGRLKAVKMTGPSFDPETYVSNESYIGLANPAGMVIMGSQLNNRVVGIGGWPLRYVQIDVPQLQEESPFNDAATYTPVASQVAFPTLGVTIEAIEEQDSVYVVHLNTTFPNSQSLQRRLGEGEWETIGARDVLPIGACRVEYRSVDAIGNYSSAAVVDVWAPRATGFIEASLAGSSRAASQYCS
jgi:hypothetical protein